VQDLHAGVPLFVNEAAFTRSWSCEPKERCTVGSGAGFDGNRYTVVEHNLTETYDWSMEWSEVPIDASTDTLRMVCVKLGYGTEERGLFSESNLIVDVDGIDELSVNGLSSPHRKVSYDADR
jgi:hypothetical protein